MKNMSGQAISKLILLSVVGVRLQLSFIDLRI